jgi:hypothetical protein
MGNIWLQDLAQEDGKFVVGDQEEVECEPAT